MVLHILANAFDNADGQLARLTKRGSRAGRALDGLADNLVFMSIYVHLCLRFIERRRLASRLAPRPCRRRQPCLAERGRGLLSECISLFCRGQRPRGVGLLRGRCRPNIDRLRWREQPWKKFLLRLYLNYIRQQEWLVPCLRELKRLADLRLTSPGDRRCLPKRKPPLDKWANCSRPIRG